MKVSKVLYKYMGAAPSYSVHTCTVVTSVTVYFGKNLSQYIWIIMLHAY